MSAERRRSPCSNSIACRVQVRSGHFGESDLGGLHQTNNARRRGIWRNRRLRVGGARRWRRGGDEAKRVFEAMMEMGKIDMAEIEAAGTGRLSSHERRLASPRSARTHETTTRAAERQAEKMELSLTSDFQRKEDRSIDLAALKEITRFPRELRRLRGRVRPRGDAVREDRTRSRARGGGPGGLCDRAREGVGHERHDRTRRNCKEFCSAVSR